MNDPGPYAPAQAADLPATVSPPRRPAVFLWAAFALSLAVPARLWQSLVQDQEPSVVSRGSLALAMAVPGLLALVWADRSDRVPLLGTRRESYLLIACAISLAAWVAAPFVPAASGPLLALAVGLGAGHAFAAPAIDGALVEISRREGASTRYAVLLYGVTALAELFAPLVESELAPRSVGWTVGFSAAMAISVALAVILSEDRAGDESTVSEAPRFPPGPLFGARSFWTIAAIAAVAVGFQQVLVQQMFAASVAAEEDLVVVARAAPLLHLGAAGAYLLLSRWAGPGWLLRGGLVALALAWFALRWVSRGELSASLPFLAREIASGMVSTGLIHLNLRAAPPGREALGYLLLTRLPIFVGTTLGVPLYIRFASDLPTTAIASVLLAGLAVWLVPSALLARADQPPPPH